MFEALINKLSKNKRQALASMSGKEAILNKKTKFNVEEAYKTARTNIMFSLPTDDKCKKVLFTSAVPGEGKTTTCLNIAITFAQTGNRVLVIDSDLRKPKIHDYMGIDRKNGLSDVLGKFTTIDEAIKTSAEHNIDYISAGQIPPNPSELLLTPELSKMLDKLSEKYDYIFIDSPPVTVVTDASALSKLVSGVILVTRENYSSHDAISKSLEILSFADAKILGIALNDINIGVSTYGGYRSYKYSYMSKGDDENEGK